MSEQTTTPTVDDLKNEQKELIEQAETPKTIQHKSYEALTRFVIFYGMGTVLASQIVLALLPKIEVTVSQTNTVVAITAAIVAKVLSHNKANWEQILGMTASIILYLSAINTALTPWVAAESLIVTGLMYAGGITLTVLEYRNA